MSLLINGEFVDDALIRQEMSALRPHYEAMMQDMEPVAREIQLRDWSRENVIERVLLRQEALRDTSPLDEQRVAERMTVLQPPPGDPDNCEAGATRAGADPEVVRAEAVAQLRLERLLARLAEKTPKPKKPEMLEFYKANLDRFGTPQLVNASHIVRNVNEETPEEAARAAIEAAAAELAAGQPFAEVADRHSDCAGQGGRLGWFPAGEMVDEFEAVVFTLEPGAVSPIFRSVFGFHIATVHERREAGVRPFAEVRAEIEELLHNERRERTLEAFVDNLKASAAIQNAKARP